MDARLRLLEHARCPAELGEDCRVGDRQVESDAARREREDGEAARRVLHKPLQASHALGGRRAARDVHPRGPRQLRAKEPAEMLVNHVMVREDHLRIAPRGGASDHHRHA